MTDRIQARPGAAFTCHGDGLCCTDIHQLGPVARAEVPALITLRPKAVARIAGVHLLSLDETHRPGGCTFLDTELRCAIHMHAAGTTRPRTCHRFPYLLARTPSGLRVGTDHRCPCRTLGERAPIDVESALPSLRDRRGRLSADRRIEGRIALAPRRHVGFARYEHVEASLLARLAAASNSEDLDAALEAEPFPELAVGSWEQVGIDLAQESRPSRYGEAFRLFGRTLAWLSCPEDARPPRLRFAPRLWQESFDRAEARSPGPSEAGHLERMLADFAADTIWGLEWTFTHSLLHARYDLVTRFAVARAFAASLIRDGARSDRAMAEAIAMIEVVGISGGWLTAIAAMRVG